MFCITPPLPSEPPVLRSEGCNEPPSLSKSDDHDRLSSSCCPSTRSPRRTSPPLRCHPSAGDHHNAVAVAVAVAIPDLPRAHRRILLHLRAPPPNSFSSTVRRLGFFAITSPDRPAIWDAMDEQKQKQQNATFLELMLSRLRSTSRYYTGYPKDLGPSRVIHFTSERQFVQLLHEGNPVAVVFTIKCPYTKHLDTVLEEAAAEFYPRIKFVRVECPKFPGFCITRQRKEYPFIEIFHSPEQVANHGKSVDPSITKYSVKVFPYNYDLSAYGFREFFKKQGMFGETK